MSLSPWQITAGLSHSRTHHQALLLKNGKVLVVGGIGTDGLPIQECELFYIGHMTWSPTGSLNNRGLTRSTLLYDGRVLTLVDNKDGLQICEIFDPDTETWVPTEAYPPSYIHILIPLSDGRVWGHGVYYPQLGPMSQGSAIFDPKSNNWVSRPFGCEAHCGICLGDGHVLIINGWAGRWIEDSPHILDIETGEKRNIDFPDFSDWGEIIRIRHDRLFYFDTEKRLSHTFDIECEEWSENLVLKSNSQVISVFEERGSSIIALTSGNVLLSGGDVTSPDKDRTFTHISDPKWDFSKLRKIASDDSGRYVVTQCAIFDHEKEVWKPAPPLNIARRFHASVLLPDSRILVIGGEKGLGHQHAIAECEIAASFCV